MVRILILAFTFSIVSVGSLAQENIPVGSWRMHISYQSAVDVALGTQRVYCAAQNGLFSYDPSEATLETITKINGLSDNGISEIAFDISQEILAVGYSSGNVDLISPSEIVNYEAIKNAQQADTLKAISHILFHNTRCYFSTGFGVVVFDIPGLETVEAYQNLGEDGTNLQIYQAAVLNDTLFLATESGVLAGSLDGSTNLQDFNSWIRFDLITGIPQVRIAGITVFDNQVHAAIDGDGIYRYVGGQWTKLTSLDGSSIRSIEGGPMNMGVATMTEAWLIGQNDDATLIQSTLVTSPNIVVTDSGGNVWLADNTNSLVSNSTGSFTSIMPSGPYSDRFYRLRYHRGQILAVPGAGTMIASPGMYVFREGLWTNFIGTEYDIAANLMDTSFDPAQGTYILPSLGGGLSTWDGGVDFETTDSSSPGYPFSGDSLSAAFSDTDGSWIAMIDAFPALYRLESSNWQTVTLGHAGEDRVLEIDRDMRGVMWFRPDPASNNGVFIFDPSTAESRRLTTAEDGGNLPSNRVYDVDVDLNGNVWLATEDGVAYVPAGVFLFQGAVNAIRPLFDGRFLFDNQPVLSIETDGGNRKWMGTRDGAWLFEEFGESRIRFFDVDNAPLLSNEITDITTNPNTGEVFFAGPAGLSSFRNDGTQLESGPGERLRIFPNPVDRKYSGYVAIEGVPNASTLKITDVAGNLVWESQAQGNTALWGLQTLNGSRLGVGIYLVYSSSTDGEMTYVGKIAVVDQ